MFAEDDATFKNLRNAFISRNDNDPERRIARLEDEINLSYAYIEAIEKCGEHILNDSDSYRHHSDNIK